MGGALRSHTPVSSVRNSWRSCSVSDARDINLMFLLVVLLETCAALLTSDRNFRSCLAVRPRRSISGHSRDRSTDNVSKKTVQRHKMVIGGKVDEFEVDFEDGG